MEAELGQYSDSESMCYLLYLAASHFSKLMGHLITDLFFNSIIIAQQSKRIYEFDEFLQTKRVRANSDRLDMSAWRSVYDAIRYVQGM